MKKITSLLSVILLSTFLLLSTGCKPNGDKNSTDDEYYNNSSNANSSMMQSDSMSSMDSSGHRDSMNMNR